jgi:hypothetical protein
MPLQDYGPGLPFVGLGTQIEFDSIANPSVFTSLMQVESVTFTGDKVATDKTTNMLSTNGVDTYLGATKEPGSCDVKCWYAPGDASQLAIEAIKQAGFGVNFQVIYPLSLGTASFFGIVESVTRTFPLSKVATFDVKIKISGPVTYVEA